jgi:hypothetical protein
MRTLRHPGGLLVVVLLVWLAAMAGAVLGAAAPARSAQVRLRRVHAAPGAVTVAVSGAARGARLQGRLRPASARRWRVVKLGTSRRLTFTPARPGRVYEVEVRACARVTAPRVTAPRRCGRWSEPLRVSAPPGGRAPGGRAPGPSGSGALGQTNGRVTCRVLPPDNAINQDISHAPVDPNSAAYVASIGASGHLHPDFGSPAQYGIPYTVVGPAQPLVPIRFTAYGDQSDPGPYPVPANAPVEGAGQPGDQHVLVVQNGTCKLYELYSAQRTAGGWDAGSGAVFNLSSDALRPDGWTSADAAGLPMFPLLVRYDEVAAGAIDHALRFTVAHTQRGYIHPATHFASSSGDPSLPPMGLRLRLKASYDLSGFSGPALVILTALKRYGMIVADNGSNWFLSGTSDPRWSDSQLDQLKSVPGSAFEVVQTGPIQH